MKIVNINEALDAVKSSDRIFVHTAACTPTILIEQLCKVAAHKNLTGLTIYHLHLEGPAPHVAPAMEAHMRAHCFFVGKNCREAVQSGRASYVPVFLSEIPLLFTDGTVPLDIALIQVSAFDEHGTCTLGPSVDATLMAVHHAKTVIAQINPAMPRVLGDGILTKKDIEYAVEMETPLAEHPCTILSPETLKIGEFVASLIDDGSTLQTGIGDIPSAVLSHLAHHRDLGIHTEMFSDGVIPLIESGVINNRFKKIHPHKVVSSFAIGSKRLYDFLHNNPLMQFMGAEFVNDPRIILKNPKVMAINSAIEIDLTGQVCADSLGTKIYSGVGGQVDFLRGAALSPGGKAIIALPSMTARGESKIASVLKPGAGVVSSRAHVQYVVTEQGIANLRGKSLKERAHALIGIAHPSVRERLLKEAHDLHFA